MRILFSAIKLDYYTPAHFFMLLIAPAIFFVLYFALRHKNEKVKFWTLMSVFAVNAALFISYKIFMGVTYDSFVLLNELPLHLCNFNVVLLPVALATKNKFLYSYLYYIGTIGAFAAGLFFDTTFLNKSVFDYGVLIYFIYHAVLLAAGALIPALRLYTPKISDILKALATLFTLAIIMHIVNTIFRKTGACVIANYFYTYGMEGNPLLGGLYKLIPVPVIYMLPIAPIAGLLDCLLYLPFRKRNLELKRLAAQKQAENAASA